MRDPGRGHGRIHSAEIAQADNRKMLRGEVDHLRQCKSPTMTRATTLFSQIILILSFRITLILPNAQRGE